MAIFTKEHLEAIKRNPMLAMSEREAREWNEKHPYEEPFVGFSTCMGVITALAVMGAIAWHAMPHDWVGVAVIFGMGVVAGGVAFWLFLEYLIGTLLVLLLIGGWLMYSWFWGA